jgi:thiosulfate/3-mercaptopyruvate sulfurtransferase
MKYRTGSPVARILGALCAVTLITMIAALPARKAAAAHDEPSRSAAPAGSEPWTDAEIVKPADLVKEMADAKGAQKPVVVCSGFQFLYETAHVPGSVYHGPALKPEGLADLKKWAQGVPRSSNLVIYCGCCPFDKCPNIRPAFEALHSMGFQHLRVLVLPNNFGKDWVENGYPVEKGK